MMLLFLYIFLMFIINVQCCLPGSGLGGYGGYGGAPYAYSYNPYAGYPASFGVPFKSRHEPTDSTKPQFLASTDSNDGCATIFSNSRLTCATAMERRLVSSQEECQRLCFEHILKCQSFEYNTITTQCDLYDVPAPEGVLAAAKASRSPFAADEPVKKDGSEYSYKLRAKRQIDLQDPLKLPQFPNYCEPEVVPAIGTNFMVPRFECAPSSQLSPTENLLESFSSSSHSRSRFQNPVSGQSSISIIPDMPDCRDGGRARIQLIDGIALISEKTPVAKIQVDSAQVCLLLCQNNAYLDGNRFSRPCVAATFDRSTGRCTIMDDAITPNGQLQYTPERETVYFEKICIPLAELPANCEDIVHRIPQRVMEGSHDATVDAHSQVECIRKCITAPKSLGFTCQSAIFYFEFPNQNCILNRFTRSTKPESFAPELRQKVDYFELAPCMISGWQRDSAMQLQWSKWSECDGSLVRSRRRNCTDCDKREETSPCISEKNFQKEFPAITHEIEKDLIPIPKQIAKNFDSAKSLQKSMTKVPEDEASLFAENDYENQNEVSYFGPPHKQQQQQQHQTKEDEAVKNYLLDSGRIEDISKPLMPGGDKSLKIHSMPKDDADDSPMIKQMEPDQQQSNFFNSVQDQTYNTIRNSPTLHHHHQQHDATPNLGEGVAVVEFPDEILQQQQRRQQNFEGLRLLPTTTSTPPNPIGKKAVQLSPIQDSSSSSLDPNECNPRSDCCPLVDMSNRKHRGCTLGYKINENNQQEGCVPESCRNKQFSSSQFMF